MKKIKINIFLISLLVILFIIYSRWMSFNIYVAGDWIFYYKETLLSLINPTAWFSLSNLGIINLITWRFPIDFLQGMFGVLGYGSNVSEKIIIFWPTLIVANLSSFFFVRKITKSNMAGFIGAIIFNYNTYYFVINTAFLLYSAAAWSVLTLYIYIHAFEKKKLYLFILSSLTLFITGSYDFRIAYVTIFLLGIYFLFFSLFIDKVQGKIFIKNCFFFFLQLIIFVLLNLYWIISFVKSNSLTSNVILQRILFGNEFSNILYSITLFHPFWTGGKTAYFTPQPIFIYFWLIPIFAILGLYLNKKNKYVLFFGLISLLGIFLTKQVGQPFSNVYPWIFDYFPGFNAFREASKFYFLIVLSYSVLIGAFINWIWRNWKKGKIKIYGKYFLFLLIICLFMFNVKPVLTGELGGIFVTKTIPEDYTILSNYVRFQKDYFRILFIPTISSWFPYTKEHPQISAVDIESSDWNNLLSKKNTIKYSSAEIMMDIFNNKNSKQLLQLSAVKYLVIPSIDKENNLNIFDYYGKSRQYYIDQLDRVDFLKKLNIGTREIIVYENYNYRPHIYITNNQESVKINQQYEKIEYKPISPTEYRFSINNIKDSFYLNFSEGYHPQWNLRVGSFNWADVLTNKNYFIDEKNHFQNDATLNSYYLDPKSICKENTVLRLRSGLDNNENGCIKNPNGGYDISGTLYFDPQSYIYLGLIISGSTLIIVLCFLSFIFGKNIYERKNK